MTVMMSIMALPLLKTSGELTSAYASCRLRVPPPGMVMFPPSRHVTRAKPGACSTVPSILLSV